MHQLIIKKFETRLAELSESKILTLSESDNSIFNVVKGFHKQSFGTYLYNDEKPNFDCLLLYVAKFSSNELKGYTLKLQPNIKERNRLTGCFASFICQEFYERKTDEFESIFNAYQDQQRSLFERLDYFTFDDDLLNELKEMNISLPIEVRLKGEKGLLYVPFLKKLNTQTIANEIKTSNNKKVKNADSQMFVYLMHNRRNNYHKIGRSIKPGHREKTLQAEDPDTHLIDKWQASGEIEKILHRKYKSKRKRGEWFDLNAEEINEIKTFMNSYTDAIKHRKH